MIGREAERRRLGDLCASSKAEFVVVYGRRRVGKTYLVREFFDNSFAFYASGIAGGNVRVQLAGFNTGLVEAGSVPGEDWFDAFQRLRALLESEDVRRDAASGRRVVFIDEMPWLDSPRSDFMAALELFWNRWGSSQKDLLLVACGSASSWIVRKLLKNRGGLHNRVTARIYLEPFTLGECEQYFKASGHSLTRDQILESYMVFGGVPYYLDLLSPRMSIAQNIDALCFSRTGDLRDEFGQLYHSLFKHAERHMAVVRALGTKACGLTLQDVAAVSGIAKGGTLSKTLEELEASGFLRSYVPFGKKRRGTLYQLVDPFSLFYLRFMDGRPQPGFWAANFQAPRVNTWRGYAFELVCLLHVDQIKRALGIGVISSDVCSWRSNESDPGAQIDLVVDRADGIVNLCEMKWSLAEYAIDKRVEESLRNKVQAFVNETGTRKAPQITLVTPHGARQNQHRWVVTSEVTADDLFSG